MLAWFLTISLLGLSQIAGQPGILAAIYPGYAWDFFLLNKLRGFVVLGSVVLCVTGGEALYADLGHFGRRPIQISWLFVALPALLLNYFGQGALLLGASGAELEKLAENPFYGAVPRPLLYPMVALATSATVIASQALISGAFSMTRQAVQLGYLPRVKIIHTSDETQGQIYIPGINWAMLVLCIGLVLAFRSSSRLAGAYGIAVTLDMTITSAMFFIVITRKWGVPTWQGLALVSLFLLFDLTYFGANLLKFFDGGWFPIVVAVVALTAMTTWKAGRAELARRIARDTIPLDLFLKDVGRTKPYRVSGTAVFMFSNPEGTPPALLHHLKHVQVLHEQVVVLSIVGAEVPTIAPSEGLDLEELGHGFYRLVARFGFMESPDVLEIMRRAHLLGLVTDPAKTSFFLGRETLLTTGRSKMMGWRKGLFAFISRNSRPATDYFGIPPGRVVELGMQIRI
jgi:KUP system potassium uptake protein